MWWISWSVKILHLIYPSELKYCNLAYFSKMSEENIHTSSPFHYYACAFPPLYYPVISSQPAAALSPLILTLPLKHKTFCIRIFPFCNRGRTRPTESNSKSKSTITYTENVNANAKLFNSGVDLKAYLKLLGETLQVVLVELHNVFNEMLNGDGFHVICRGKHTTVLSKGLVQMLQLHKFLKMPTLCYCYCYVYQCAALFGLILNEERGKNRKAYVWYFELL